MDVWEMDIRRFGPHFRSPRYTLKRAKEVYETYYDIRYPGHERQAGRPLRISSAYPWHAEHGAAFGEKSGWERVNWYEATPPPAMSRCARAAGRACTGRRRSAPSTARPARRAGLFDESSFAKLELAGRAPRSCSNGSATTASRGMSGAITYTQMLNRRGGIECDFTVTRLGEDRSRSSPAPRSATTTLSWIRRHLPADGSVRSPT